VNPAAGNGRCGQLAANALQELRSRGVALDVSETHGPGDATRLARAAAAQGRRRFIAVGGDGTGFEIVNGLTEYLGASDPAQRVSLGFLPLGTGNSFLRDFGAGDTAQAIAALAEERARACDLLRLEHDAGALHYMNLLSLGFVAEICRIANRRFKRLGSAGYGLGVVAALVTLHSRLTRLRVDGGPAWEQAMVFLSVCNSRFTGGSMMMAPYADTSDGQADVIVCGAMDRLTLLSTFPKIFRGHHVYHHQISASRARSIEFFETQAIDLMIDGEVMRHTPKRLDVCPAALDVFV
jgi:YegS/Rv2252/BmrU family lipid kinase